MKNRSVPLSFVYSKWTEYDWFFTLHPDSIGLLWENRNYDQIYEALLCASDDVWQGPGLHKQVASLAAARWWFAQFVHRQCFSNLPESTEPAQSLHNLFKSSQKGCHGDRWIKMDIQWPVLGLLLVEFKSTHLDVLKIDQYDGVLVKIQNKEIFCRLDCGCSPPLIGSCLLYTSPSPRD